MRVLHVIDSLALGGAERSLAELVPALRAGGCDVHVAYLHDRPGLGPAVAEGGGVLHDLSRARGRVGWMNAVTELIGVIRPDIVHTTLFEADQAGRVGAWRHRRPVVSSLVSEMYGSTHRAESMGRGARLRAAQTLDITTSRLVTRFHAVSGSVADAMAPRLRVRRDRIDVIGRGRDTTALEAAAAGAAEMRRRFDVPDGAPLVVGVGRLAHAKGFDVLLDAVPDLLCRHPDTRVLIAGGDADASSRLRSHPVHGAVQWCGHVDGVAALIAAADVLAFPSRREGLPGTVIEAFALGTPVVCSDIAPLRELAGTGEPTALVVPVDDPGALSVAIGRVLDGDVDVGALTRRARERFDAEFTIESTAARHIAQYRRVLDA